MRTPGWMGLAGVMGVMGFTQDGQIVRKFNVSKDIEQGHARAEDAHAGSYPVMKKLSLIIALFALALAAYLGLELSRTRELLRQRDEKAAALVPLQANLEASRSTQEALTRAEAGQADLVRQLREKQKEIQEAERRLALATARIANTPSAIHLGKGSYTLDDGTVVYGPETQLRLPNGMLVSSPSGVMVSDASLTHIDGDLVIETPEGRITTTDGFLSLEDGHMQISGATLQKK